MAFNGRCVLGRSAGRCRDVCREAWLGGFQPFDCAMYMNASMSCTLWPACSSADCFPSTAPEARLTHKLLVCTAFCSARSSRQCCMATCGAATSGPVATSQPCLVRVLPYYAGGLHSILCGCVSLGHKPTSYYARPATYHHAFMRVRKSAVQLACIAAHTPVAFISQTCAVTLEV